MNSVDISVINAHTGRQERLSTTDSSIFKSINTFKEWIENNFKIPVPSIILLTPFGIKFNFNMLTESTEIFVFNRDLFTNTKRKLDSDDLGSLLKPRPSSLSGSIPSQLSSRQLLSSLIINSGWSTAILSDSMSFNEKITLKMNEISILFKSLNVIFQYFNLFCKEIEKSYQIGLEFFINLQKKTLNKTWKDYQKQLRSIRFNNIILSQFLDEKALERSAQGSLDLFPKVDNIFKTMKTNVSIVAKDKISIDKEIESLRNESIKKFKAVKPQDILANIKNLNDETQKDIKILANASENEVKKMFTKHQKEFNFNMHSSAIDIYNILISLHQFKEYLQRHSVFIFSSIATSQMKMVQVKHGLKTVKEDIEKIQSFERLLSYTVDLPALYGIYIVENVRRAEWLKEIKSLTSTSAENFAQITEKERKYRDSWLRKFDTFLKFLSTNNFEDDITPAIDLTITNAKYRSDSYLEYIRSDIERYIETLKRSKIKNETITVLENALTDLDNKRLNLQKVNIMQITEESELVKGYLLRIKKLESLLHQAQYKNLNQWPSNNLGNQFSLVVDPNSSSFQKQDRSLLRRQTIQVPSKTPSPGRIGSTDSIQTSKLPDSYSNIDKHLDNIRLNKENQEKDIKLNELNNVNTIQEQEINQLKEQLKVLQTEKEIENNNIEELKRLKDLETENQSLKHSIKAKDDEIHNIVSELSEKDSKISKYNEEKKVLVSNYESQLSNSAEKIRRLSTSNELLSQEIYKIKSSYQDLDSMKKDLLTNMSSKESEFSRERNLMNEEINLLKLRLEECEDTEENVEHLKSELIYQKHQSENMVASLNQILLNFINKSKHLSQFAFSKINEMCLILESIGLLLVTGKEGELQVIRVKGLRAKSKDQVDETNFKPTSVLIKNIEEQLSWTEANLFTKNNVDESIDKIDMASNVTNDTKSVNTDMSNRIYDEIEDEVIKESLKLVNAYENEQFETNYNNFMNAISINDRLIVHAISKRFKDVENLAKRLQKDNKSSKDQLINMSKEYSSKISIRNFQKNDLVLFLPTRDATVNISDSDPSVDKIDHPWAAFNIGAPHFFLNNQKDYNLNNRDWLLARIDKITEYHVTKDNFKTEENPFSLSQGVTWFFIDAEEEILDVIF